MEENSRKMKMGLVGFGVFGEAMALPAIQAHSDQVQMSGIVDTNTKARKKAESKGLFTSGNVEEFLDKNPDVDYLYIAITPVNLVKFLDSLAEYLVKNNRKISICLEKPMGYDLEEALEIYALVTEKTFQLATVFNRFSYPTFKHGLDLLTQGTVGKLMGIDDFIAISGPPPFLKGWVKRQQPGKHRGIALLNGFHSNSLVPLLLGLPQEIHATILNTRSYPGTHVDDLLLERVRTKQGNATLTNRWGIHDEVKLSAQLRGKNGSIVIEQWGRVGVAQGNATSWQTLPSQTDREESTQRGNEGSFIKEHAIAHDAGIWGFHRAIIEHLSQGEELPHHIQHSVELAVLSMLMIDMSYASQERGESVTPEEILKSRLPNFHNLIEAVKLPGNY